MAKPLPELAPAPPWVIPDKDAHRVALILIQNERERLIDIYLFAGQCILAEVFENKFEVWNRRNVGDQSVPKIVDELHALGHTDWNKDRIFRSVKLFEQDVALGGLRRWKNLGVKHFVIAQQLDLAKQAAVLEDADARALTVEELEAIVKDLCYDAKPAPKADPDPKGLKAIYHTVERLRRMLAVHDELLVQVREAGLDAGVVKAFDGCFDKFTRNIEDLVLFLHNLGAEIPEDDLKVFREHQAKEFEEARKAMESKRAEQAKSAPKLISTGKRAPKAQARGSARTRKR